MSNTYTWKIVQLGCTPKVGTDTDVVQTIHWRIEGTDGTHTGSVYGSVGITLDTSTTFVPFASLTEADVISWAQAALGAEQVAAFEANIDAQIAAAANPPVVSPALPWA